jgi:hypothetical protein
MGQLTLSLRGAFVLYSPQEIREEEDSVNNEKQRRSQMSKLVCVLPMLLLIVCAYWFWYAGLSHHPGETIAVVAFPSVPTSLCSGGSGTFIAYGTQARFSAADIKAGRLNIFPPYREHHALITAMGCDSSHSSTRVATGDEAGVLRVWALYKPWEKRDYVTIMTYTQHPTSPVRALAWSYPQEIAAFVPGGQVRPPTLALAEETPMVRLLSVPQGKVMATYQLSASLQVTSLRWSYDNRYLAVGGGNRQTHTGFVEIWDVKTGQLRTTYTGHAAGVTALSWSQNSRWVASASRDGTVQIWEAATGMRKLTYQGHRTGVTALSWIPPAAYLQGNLPHNQVVSGSEDGSVQIWNTDTGSTIATIWGQQGPITAVAWFGDEVIAGSADKTVHYFYGIEVNFHLINPTNLPVYYNN